MFDLSEKVAIVTGSSRGIGRGIAQQLAKQGARVVITSRKLEPCEAVVEEIKQAGGQAMAVASNVGHKEDVTKLVEKTVEAYGRLDIVVCNAAANPAFGPMQVLEDAAFDKIMRVNLQSNIWLCNLAGPHMAKVGGGSMILISSITALDGSRVIGAYALSKAAQLQLARNLAVEWGHKNIRANCIAPGLIQTDFAKALWENDEIRKQIESRTPLGRIGEPDDIAGVAGFLASDASRYVTGQVIVADGGAVVGGEM